VQRYLRKCAVIEKVPGNLISSASRDGVTNVMHRLEGFSLDEVELGF
jgi:hypothetical protein